MKSQAGQVADAPGIAAGAKRGPSPFQRLALATYLLVTLGGFVFTVSHYTLPVLPWQLIFLSYSTMAPLQSYARQNEDVLFEGQQSDGTWSEINVVPYFPMRYGQRIARMRQRGFVLQARDTNDPKAFLLERYRGFAKLLLEQERARGRLYGCVRLSRRTWPLSTEGPEALRHRPFVMTSFITQYP